MGKSSFIKIILPTIVCVGLIIWMSIYFFHQENTNTDSQENLTSKPSVSKQEIETASDEDLHTPPVVSTTPLTPSEEDDARVSYVKHLQLAMELYFDRYSSYPVLLSELIPEFIDEVGEKANSDFYLSEKFYATGPANSERKTFYHLGILLDSYTHPSLKKDADLISGPGMEKSYTGGFDGTSSNCRGGTGEERCYDVTP